MLFDTMKTASKEIRALVVEAYSTGVASREQLAEIFGYHVDSIGRWIRESRTTKRLAPLPRGHRLSVFNGEERRKLIEFLEKHPEATLDDIRKHFQKRCSLAAIHNTLGKLGFSLQKNAAGKRLRMRGSVHEPGKNAFCKRHLGQGASCL